MLLTKVILTNFKKHKNLTVDLRYGLNTISGPNYSGKTTIEQAILYAFFGAAVLPGKGEDLVTVGQTSKPKVELEWAIFGHKVEPDEYLLVRSGSNAKLSKNGEVTSQSSSAVNKEVERLMGLSKDQFLKTRVSKQGDAQALLSTGTQELKKLVEALSGCLIVDALNREAKVKLKTLADKTEALLSTIDNSYSLTRLERDAGNRKRRFKIRANTLANATDIFDLKRGILDTASFNLREANKVHNKYVDYLARLDSYTKTLDERTKEGNEYIKDPALHFDKEELLGEEESLELEYEALNRAKADYDNAELRFETLRAKSEEAKSRVEKSLVKEPRLEVPLDMLVIDKSIIDLAASASAMSDKCNALEKLLSEEVCPTCSRTVGDIPQKEAEGYKDELATWRNELPKTKKLLKEATEKSKAWYKHEADLVGWSAKHKMLVKNLGDLNNEESEASKLCLTMSCPVDKEIDNCRFKLIGVKNKFKLAVAATDAMNSVLAHIKQLKGQIAELNKPEDADVEEAEARQGVAAFAVKTSEADLNLCREEHNTAESLYLESKNKYEKTKEILDRVKLMSSDQSGYKSITKVIADNRAKMMEGVWLGILSEATEFVSSCTSKDISELSVDDKFSLRYTEYGHTHPIDSASGAQKSLIGLGLRLAIANMLPSNVDFLLLDEISADMTEEISAIAMTQLRIKCTQSLSISHREADSSTSDNLIVLGV